MATPQHQRRKRANEPSQQDESPTESQKRARVEKPSQEDDHQVERSRRPVEHLNSWQYPPQFWDRLSKVPLVHSALEELDRRTRTRHSGRAQDPAPTATRQLARFARHGGPDLRGLRGYPEHAGAINSFSRSRGTQSTDPTAAMVKLTTAYDRAFDQHMTDYSVWPVYQSREPELAGTRAALAVRRPSLRLSKFSQEAFKAFQDSNARAKDESDVNAHVIPAIMGARRTDDLAAMNTLFGNLEQLTDGSLAPAKPDYYYGAYPEQLGRSIRNDLASHIIPSTMEDKPMAPNFFLEVKGPIDSAAIVTRQARYDGAIGSRALHSLQNYNKEEPTYDGKPYTFTSTYYDGTLKLYAHHITAPTTEGGRPEYHMTPLTSYAMTNDRKTFIQGATAFRNARDLAKRHRDAFIQAANATIAQAAAAAAAVAQDDLSPASDESHESMDDPDYIIGEKRVMHSSSALPTPARRETR